MLKELNKFPGQQPNEPVMYEALYGILPYFRKAYELDQLPNEKGKVKPKYTKRYQKYLERKPCISVQWWCILFR